MRFHINRYFNNILISGLPGVLSIFLSFFSIPLFLNLIPADLYANYLIQHSILTLGMVLNFNLGKFAAIKIQNLNLNKKKQIIFTTIMASIVLGAIFSAITYLIIKFFFEGKNFFDITFSLFLGIFTTILYISIDHIVKGLQYFKLSSFFNFLFYSLSLSLPAFFLIIESLNLKTVNNLFIVSLYVKFFSLFCLVAILILKNDLKITKLNFALLSELKNHAKWMTITEFYNQIYNYVDKYLIKISLGSTMLLAYAVPQLIAAKLAIFSQAMTSVLLPKLSATKNEKQKKNILSANLYFFSNLMGFSLIIALPFFDKILPWWLDNAYNIEILNIFKIFILIAFLVCLSSIIVTFYEGTLVAKKNTQYETFIIIPFFIGLIYCTYHKSIFLFAFLIMLKEIIMLFIRLINIRKYIFNYLYFNTGIILFFVTYSFSIMGMNYLSYISSFIFAILLCINFPLKIILKEFF
jgi:O-antigen/teichoic acid export membrane protein|tara:strand:+ start:1230 stop:2627 length:1398 start_codon:yes stop_codon:yes gene_type:complete